MFNRLLLGVRFGIPGPTTGLLMVAALVALSACASPTSPVEPPTAPSGQGDSPPNGRDPQESQDRSVSEPELPATPTVTADAEPDVLMYSALDLALQGEIQGVYEMGKSGDSAYIPDLIDMMRFSHRFPAEEIQPTILLALADIAEQNFPEFVSAEADTWSWWVKWLGRHSEVKSPPDYAAWKGRLIGQLVDPDMGAFLHSIHA